jgi:hypothetical protein
MEDPSALSAFSAQFPRGWEQQWQFLDERRVLHIATDMVFVVTIGPAVEHPQKRKAVVHVQSGGRMTDLDLDLTNFMAAQAVKLVLES